MENRILLLNEFWSKQEEFKLTTPFAATNNFFCGEIELVSPPKEKLIFETLVPFSYPFSNDTLSIRFICKNVSGYGHMNGDNSICTIVPKESDFIKRLNYEVILLKEWRDKYYVQEIEDEKYDYPIIPQIHNDTFLFTDLDKTFVPFQIGKYYAFPHSNNSNLNLGFSSKIFLIQGFDNSFSKWNEIINVQTNPLEGYYFFLDKEPLSSGRITTLSWIGLNDLISHKGKELLYKIKTGELKCKTEEIFVLLGYKIPKTEEVHWQALKIIPSKIPIKGKRIGPKNYTYSFNDQEIEWCKTHNASYNRFFGRGALHTNLVNKKILIVGAGAIGSSLAKILTRAGAKYIGLSDMESIEPGNICRSEFILSNISTPKTIALTQQLYSISPFVQINFEHTIDKCLFSENIKNTKENLEKYDIIFDCTSDTELSYVLDELNLNKDIFNLSLSNKADELVCVNSRKNITKEKHQLFSKLSTEEPKLIYEGTGCWSSTFEASYFDINSLLNLAVKKINLQYEHKTGFNSFIVKPEINNLSIKINVIDY